MVKREKDIHIRKHIQRHMQRHRHTHTCCLQTLPLTNLSPQAIGSNTVFVSTDSPDVIQELELKAPPGLTIISELDEIRGTDITNANLMNNLRLNVTRSHAQPPTTHNLASTLQRSNVCRFVPLDSFQRFVRRGSFQK